MIEEIKSPCTKRGFQCLGCRYSSARKNTACTAHSRRTPHQHKTRSITRHDARTNTVVVVVLVGCYIVGCGCVVVVLAVCVGCGCGVGWCWWFVGLLRCVLFVHSCVDTKMSLFSKTIFLTSSCNITANLVIPLRDR